MRRKLTIATGLIAFVLAATISSAIAYDSNWAREVWPTGASVHGISVSGTEACSACAAAYWGHNTNGNTLVPGPNSNTLLYSRHFCWQYSNFTGASSLVYGPLDTLYSLSTPCPANQPYKSKPRVRVHSDSFSSFGYQNLLR